MRTVNRARTSQLLGGKSIVLPMIFLVALFILSVNPTNATSTTIVGANDPNVDLPAVQAAVDGFDSVTLSGTFNFGPPDGADYVWITKAVTLQGPATIRGYIYVTCPDVKILDLTIDSPFWPNIWVDSVGPGNAIEVKNNTLTTDIYGLYMWNIQSPVEVTGNQIYSNSGGGAENPVLILSSTGGGNVSENTIATNGTGVNITSWFPDINLDGENEPFYVTNNTLSGHHSLYECCSVAIVMGFIDEGVSDSVVSNNTITGDFRELIVNASFGNRNVYINNDFSDATTVFGVEFWGGRDNTFMNNTIGPALWSGAASLLHPLGGEGQVNERNSFIGNNYRHTGLSGHTIELIDLGVGPPVDNLVIEHVFPKGTDVCDQIVDLGINTNIPGYHGVCAPHPPEVLQEIIAQRTTDTDLWLGEDSPPRRLQRPTR